MESLPLILFHLQVWIFPYTSKTELFRYSKAKSKESLELAATGTTKQAIADQLGIGVASVYRVLKESQI